MEAGSGVTRSIIHELFSSDIQVVQMEVRRGVTRSIIDELHCSDIQEDQMEVNVVLLEVSLLKFIVRRSKEIKRKVKVVLL